MGRKRTKQDSAIATNRKARHKYEIMETFETGIALRGTEVKSLRSGNVSIAEGYARIRKGELFLVCCTIQAYENGSYANHKPDRPRKLLLHKREIRRLGQKTQQRGLTLVPLKVYFNERGLAKVLLGLARGKSHRDKRQDLRKEDQQREMARAKSRRR